MFKKVSVVFAALVLTAPSLLTRTANAQVVDILPEQHAYEARTDAQLRSWIHENNREATDEERAFIDTHWRRAARIWRIRRLAKEANDTAIVARCDLLLARADHILEAQIRRFRERAPLMTYAPGIEATMAPPPPQVETPGAPPPGQQWVPGYWHWNGARHVWMGGHFMAPPQPGYVYDAPRWENRNNRWYFNDGRWRVGAMPAANVVYEPPTMAAPEVVIQTAPPAPLVEVRPVGPAGGVWIPGYWHWNGNRHVWLSGRWSAARAGYRWEPDHWGRSGNGWQRQPGRWVR